jgi:hypothetical protein
METQDGQRHAGGWRRWAGVVAGLGALLLVGGFFHWTVKSGGGFNPPGEEDYYNFLVRGWRAGHLHLAKEPNPGMLTLADPYDPAQNSALRMGDASYYQGRYYLYFGAAPAALVMLPYGLITGEELGTTTTIYIFCVIGFGTAALLWLRVRRDYFPESAWWVAPLGVLVLGCASHVLALQRRPLVWELPIATAYACSMLMLAGIYRWIHRPTKRAALLAGLSWGVAIAARPTYLLAGFALLPVLWTWWRSRRAGATPAPLHLPWSGGGLAVCLTAILAHNYARFENPFEFGQNYQLSGVYESKMAHFRPAYVPHNVGIYYFHPPDVTGKFPFLAATAVDHGPPGYLAFWNEPVAGLAVTFPFLWLALATPLAWCGREAEERRRLRLAVLAVAGLFAGMSAITLSYFLATPRYMADFTPSLALLAVLGWLGVERWARGRAGGWAVLALGVVAAGVTIVAGVLVSLDYHRRLIRTVWPDGWTALEQFFARLGF